MDGDRPRLEPRHAEKLNRERRKLRLKWTDIARRADMSPQNLLRIRNGEITVSEDAAEGLDEAYEWTPGKGIDAILRDEEPTARPRRIDIDPLRDEVEEAIWSYVDVVGEERVWRDIDTRRANIARARAEAEANRKHQQDSA